MSEIKVDCIDCGKTFSYFTEDVDYDEDNLGLVQCPHCSKTNTVETDPDDDDEF